MTSMTGRGASDPSDNIDCFGIGRHPKSLRYVRVSLRSGLSPS